MFKRNKAMFLVFASLVFILPASAHAAGFTEPTGPNEPNPTGSQPTWTMSWPQP